VSFTIPARNPDDTLVEQGRAQHILGKRSTTGSRSITGFIGSKRPNKRGRAVVRELFLISDEDAEEAGWQERALCAQTDPEAFFPEKGGSTREAKKVCLTCDVRTECLESALMNDERFGIWGGLSERERRKLKKRAV
jgi:WhiB family redox-sensing transcriptional regulator